MNAVGFFSLEEKAMERPFKSLWKDELLEIVEQSLQFSQPDIERATEAFDEAIRRQNGGLAKTIAAIFKQAKLRPIPWLTEAKKSLSVSERPPRGHYQGHLYVVLIDGFTEQSQFYGAYVGSSRYKPETRFNHHKTGRNASNIVQKRGLQVIKSRCWPDEQTVPGGRQMLFWESALNRCLARAIPKVRGDFKPIEEWDNSFQRPLRRLCGSAAGGPSEFG